MKALSQIGFRRALRFLLQTFVLLALRCTLVPPIRILFLRIMGAKIGKNCVIHGVNFINFYRGTFRNLEIGNECFIGGEVLLDLANKIKIGSQTTVSERSIILTHLNVGYPDHPLQSKFPADSSPVKIGSGVFIGVNTVVLHGVEIGDKAFIGANSLVNKSVSSNRLAAGSPAKVIREI